MIYNEGNPEGFTLLEPYVKNTSPGDTRIKLRSDEYFMMGDNRNASSDSRYWGPVKRDLLVGRALLRLWPFGRLSIFPGAYNEES